jgi:CrcB protein
MRLLAVAIGSAIGGMLRYGVATSLAASWPWPTLLVNVLGGLAIGFFASRPGLDPTLRAALIPGFCGGFTTFSAFSADTVMLWQTNPAKAAAYVILSVAISLGAVVAGTSLGTLVPASSR